MVQKASKKLQLSILKTGVFVASFLTSLLARAEGSPMEGDITKTLLDGTITQTLGKSGLIWSVLTAISLIIAAISASMSNNPKAFFPAFVVCIIISAITKHFITF